MAAWDWLSLPGCQLRSRPNLLLFPRRQLQSERSRRLRRTQVIHDQQARRLEISLHWTRTFADSASGRPGRIRRHLRNTRLGYAATSATNSAAPSVLPELLRRGRRQDCISAIWSSFPVLQGLQSAGTFPIGSPFPTIVGRALNRLAAGCRSFVREVARLTVRDSISVRPCRLRSGINMRMGWKGSCWRKAVIHFESTSVSFYHFVSLAEQRACDDEAQRHSRHCHL
jgi:hypothetical protein